MENVSTQFEKDKMTRKIKKKTVSSVDTTSIPQLGDLNSELAANENTFNPVWKRKTNIPTSRPEYHQPIGVNKTSFSNCNTPTDVFLVFIDSILEDIVYQTNLYGTQMGKNLNIKKENILAFIGINFVMGYNRLPS